MGFLVQYTLASLLVAAALIYVYDHTIGQVVNRVTNTTVRAGLFVGAWTALTAFLGLRGFSKLIRGLREKMKGVNAGIGPVPKHRD